MTKTVIEGFLPPRLGTRPSKNYNLVGLLVLHFVRTHKCWSGRELGLLIVGQNSPLQKSISEGKFNILYTDFIVILENYN